jgi:hypothetical protein
MLNVSQHGLQNLFHMKRWYLPVQCERAISEPTRHLIEVKPVRAICKSLAYASLNQRRRCSTIVDVAMVRSTQPEISTRVVPLLSTVASRFDHCVLAGGQPLSRKLQNLHYWMPQRSPFFTPCFRELGTRPITTHEECLPIQFHSPNCHPGTMQETILDKYQTANRLVP